MRTMGEWTLFALLSLVTATSSMSVFAGEYDGCFEAAGEKYGISPALLKAIARVESDMNPEAYVELQNTESRGIMQINSFWYPFLEEHGISADDLWNPCTNIHVGAWVLSQEIVRYGNSWTAVGAYYAGAYTNKTKEWKKKHYIVYAERVYRKLNEQKQRGSQ